MRLCIDLDGCVVEYPFPTLAKKYFNINLNTCAIYAYDLADVLGVSNLAINTMFREQVYGAPRFIQGALFALKELEKKHELIIYSNRVKYMGEKGLGEWLIKYDIPFHGIDSQGQGNYDVHIDDSPAKLMNTDSKLKLLYSQPWNLKCLNVSGKLKRVYSWVNILEQIGCYDAIY